MKSIIMYYEMLHNRPMYKFFLNIFVLKEIYWFSIKHLQYIQIFLKLTKTLDIKLFKFNYKLWDRFLFYYVVWNLSSQVGILIYVNFM